MLLYSQLRSYCVMAWEALNIDYSLLRTGSVVGAGRVAEGGGEA